jgi:hypothetical protein
MCSYVTNHLQVLVPCSSWLDADVSDNQTSLKCQQEGTLYTVRTQKKVQHEYEFLWKLKSLIYHLRIVSYLYYTVLN